MDLQSQLSQIIHPSRVLTSHLHRIAYANDASYFRLVPQAVVQPNSIGEIQALFKFTQRNKIPMTFRAAGTSLSGQAVTDGILVDISKHWGKYSVEAGGKLIRFQPGIVGGFINNVLKGYGRRIGPDPASIDACMMGGILANNSSGMCCGVVENSYHTIHSMTIVFPNGFVLDTATLNANQIFKNEQPYIAKGLLELKRRIMESPSSNGKGIGIKGKGESLSERIHRRYQLKNTNGYLLNAFLDFNTPLDILTHIMIGSEGTLGFIAEGVLYTLPDYPRRYTGQLYFKNLKDAASAITPIKESGARAAEIMDRAALRSVQHYPDVPAILHQLPEGATAILVEYQAQDTESINRFKKEAEQIIRKIKLLHDPEFTDDPIAQASLWKTRKGIIPSIGGMRTPGTVSINEDVVFPIHHLADAVTDLQYLFRDFGYPDGAVFGHAKDGNLHFLINQAFNTDSDIAHFDRFVHAMVNIVSGKYDGALKAEHGTGRNMAPFVETEWGMEAYAIMRDLKSLFDPDHMLNPGVMINENKQAHVTHLKSMTLVSPEIDKCIECGFCESKCPSRYLTLTPRQRIVVQRELARMSKMPRNDTAAGDGGLSDRDRLSNIIDDFSYAGINTCAVDGLCATACPVNINTGDLTRRLRAESITPRNERIANWLAEHFSFTEFVIGSAARLGHLAESVLGASGVNSMIRTAENITNITLPKWYHHIPFSSKNLSALPGTTRQGRCRVLNGKKEFIYFPSCISRQLGVPRHHSRTSNPEYRALPETLVAISNRANINLLIPADTTGTCCGMPFHSKGYIKAYQSILHKTILKFWAWSEDGKYPIVIDTTSCAQSLRSCDNDLTPEDKELWKKLTILDSIEFIHDILLPKLKIQPVEENIILHPNCSARKLGLESKILAIAKQCARSATVPLNLGCCGFAGDRGLLFPELTASATQKESFEVNAREYGGYYSSNIPCEISMSEATGKDYTSIVYLVERASRRK
ncbi:MAG TPA: FAD-binding and (Fe-S)-binding domain-containing protein, partial [Anaerolineales bacterium]|nr:FAD-binding and (Fe-S)-binding domain-containing protein [Anaerolineales bacterium]